MTKTNTETLTINKANWSGEEATIIFRNDLAIKGSEFSIYDYNFKLVAVETDDDDLDILELRGEGWNYPLATITKWAGSKEWTAISMDISRENSDPRIAAAQIIFMTV